MKFLYDYFPVIIFFIAYKLYGIYAATAAAMVAAFLQVTLFWIKNRRFEKLHLVTFLLIFLLGSITLIFHRPIFIKWKPSIIYWLFAAILMGSQYLTKKPLLTRMMGDKFELPHRAWKVLNLSWGFFFFIMGFLNLYVVYHYSTNLWVDFKLFGTLGLTIIFTIFQAIYIAKYLKRAEKAEKSVNR